MPPSGAIESRSYLARLLQELGDFAKLLESTGFYTNICTR